MNAFLHHPPHIFLDNTWYFITAHTVGSEPPLKQTKPKIIWTNTLNQLADQFEIIIYAHVLLDNHYHFLGYFPDSTLIPKLIKHLHGSTSYQINKLGKQPGRKIWHNYWDRIIRNEADFFTKLNYIHYNPVKHEYVCHPEHWEFSTYNDHLKEKGEDWMQDCWMSYPIKEYNFEN